MDIRSLSACLLVLIPLAPAGGADGAEPLLPPGDKEPLFRLETGGASSFVTALVFSPDGKTLYSGGWDKVVRVWKLDAAGRFVPDEQAYRVPIGPGVSGAINCLALSDDGGLLAVAGLGMFRGEAGFRTAGRVWPALGNFTAEMLQDLGMVYVFNTRDKSVRLLRGHRGAVSGLTFLPSHPGKPPLLVSVARERDQKTGEFGGAVRLWDARQGTSVARRGGLPDLEVRPGLAAWHSGEETAHVRVALAWGDGVFRVWDVAGGPDGLHEARDHRYNLTAVPLDGGRRVVTAGYGVGRARFRTWTVGAGGISAEALPALAANEIDVFPQALALLPGRADGAPDRAAVVLRSPGRGEEYRLQLVGLGAERNRAVLADEVLWRGSARQSALAVAPGGRHLAVAGNQSHDILVYTVEDLLNRRGQPQKLASAGAIIRDVAFATRDRAVALALNESARERPGAAPAPLRKGGLLLDLERSRLTATFEGWRTALPDPGEWRAEPVGPGGRSGLRISRGGRQVAKVDFPSRWVVTDWSLLPPGPPLKVPLLAVAFHDNGQPVLGLFHGETGEQLRQFRGHTERITALAFSPDGRLLTSAAEDQTVCVWSLTDLDRILGVHGLLRGLTVQARDGALAVAKVEPGPAEGKLRPGDTVTGLVENGKLRPLNSPRAFYEAVDAVRPGTELTFRVLRGDETHTLSLVVGQGVDERKPLFTMFLTRGGPAEERAWLGWSPVGLFEASAPAAERFAGWHFNTGEAGAPARFASLDQYRKKYHRPGILKDLVARGKLEVPAPAPLPAPKLGLDIEEGGRFPEADARGQRLVRNPRVNLKVGIGEEVALDALESLTWRLDRGEPLSLDPDLADEQTWSVPLRLTPGAHTVRLVARTRENPPREYSRELAVRFQPPPPLLRFKDDQAGAKPVVREKTFDLQVLVAAGTAGENVTVTIRHRQGDQDLFQESRTYRTEAAQPRPVSQRLELRPGYNRIEASAVNGAALEGYEEAETSRLTLEVMLVKKADPPLISLDAVLPGSEGGENLPRQAVDLTRPVVVNVPTVRVLGRVEAKELLSRVEWTQGTGAPKRALTRFEPLKNKEFTFQEVLALQPGLQTVRFLARADGGDETAERALAVDYRPALPQVALPDVDAGVDLFGETETGTFPLRAGLRLPPDRQPFTARVLVDGHEAPEPPQVDVGREILTARVPVRPGRNRVQVRLSNRWGEERITEALLVRYARPPRVLALERIAGTDPARADLHARVRSPLSVSREDVRVEVNGRVQRVQVVVGEKPSPEGVWNLRLRGVALEGKRKADTVNVIRLRVSNPEHDCLEPGTLQVVYRPAEPPPQVEFIEPREDLKNVTEPRLKVRLRAVSESPLKKLSLTRKDQPPQVIDPSFVRHVSGDVYEAVAELELSAELNSLRAEALNDSGLGVSQELVVNYVPRLASVAIDGLEAGDAGGDIIHPVKLPEAGLEFPDVPEGRVRLHGRVSWGKTRTGPVKRTTLVRVYVNGFLQVPAQLRPASDNVHESTFRADILLNRAEGNEIHVRVPDLALDSEGGCKCTIRKCRKPVVAQRLHLLVLSTREQEEGALREQVFQAFRIEAAGKGRYRSGAFDPVYPYGPLVGYYCRPESVDHQLFRIKTRIKDLIRAGAFSNDVVILYYEGDETFDASRHYLGAPGQTNLDATIDMNRIAGKFTETPGAHILLLDVYRSAVKMATLAETPVDQVKRWKDFYPELQSHVVVIRYAWLGGKEAPPAARLITALRTVMPRAHSLVDATQRMEVMASAPGAATPNMKYEMHLPAGLKDLDLRQSR